MCTVSMIGDHFNEKWQDIKWPQYPNVLPNTVTHYVPSPSRAEFEALKKEVLEMKELLKRAVKYDEDNGQPHCEQDEKIAMLKKIAGWVGVSLDDVLK